MIINRIELTDYRNYEALELDFDKGTNILFGDTLKTKMMLMNICHNELLSSLYYHF